MMTATTSTPAPVDELREIRERLVRLETVVYWFGGPVALLLVTAALKVLFGAAAGAPR